jgi:hypothetical protein
MTELKSAVDWWLGTSSESASWWQMGVCAALIYFATLLTVCLGEKRFLGRYTVPSEELPEDRWLTMEQPTQISPRTIRKSGGRNSERSIRCSKKRVTGSSCCARAIRRPTSCGCVLSPG